MYIMINCIICKLMKYEIYAPRNKMDKWICKRQFCFYFVCFFFLLFFLRLVIIFASSPLRVWLAYLILVDLTNVTQYSILLYLLILITYRTISSFWKSIFYRFPFLFELACKLVARCIFYICYVSEVLAVVVDLIN